MLEKYIPKRFATAMIKHVIAVTLFFPYFYSHNNNPAYADFMLVNVFVILAIVFICTSWKLDFKRNGIFVGILGVLLLAYNGFATYMNLKYHHWYGDQFNTTLAFLFFMLLLLVKDNHALIDTATIKSTIHMIVASNVLAIFFRLVTGYNRIIFMNDWVQLTSYTRIDLKKQYSWLYGHKSEYGLMLVLCVAFFIVYRKQFRNTFTYFLSLGVLFVTLYISDSYTAFGAALLIFAGQFLDYLITAKWKKKVIFTILIPIPIIYIAKRFIESLETNRDILTLGSRTHIWDYFWEYIKAHPNGAGVEFGNYSFPIYEWKIATNNAHNVFLNHMLRFSLPVGFLFVALCVIIVLFALKRNLSLSTICVWMALFIPIMMDNSLTSVTLSYILFLIFSIFFNKKVVRV